MFGSVDEADNHIKWHLSNGWFVASMAGFKERLFVVFERVNTDCGQTINCIGCLAQGKTPSE